MKLIVLRTACLLFSLALTSCASVDQFGSRAYDGNLNTQSAVNQEVLANIIRASQYQALSWNPASQITGAQSESLATGLPTINIGPAQTAAQHIYSITNSVTSGVNGGYTTTPLATTSFQAGMLTPVDLKTIAGLMTYYPREVVLYSLIKEIDLETVSTPHAFASLVNDPSQAYANIEDSNNLDQSICDEIIGGRDNYEWLFHKGKEGERQCSYAKFLNLLSVLIDSGLTVELVQIPAPQPAQAQANQSNIVTVGRFCFNGNLTGDYPIGSDLPRCGLDKKQSVGGTIVTGTTEIDKADDAVINTKTKSVSKTITTTRTSIIPVGGHEFPWKFRGVEPVYLTFELRSPNGFMSYLGSWYNVRDHMKFEVYNRDKGKRALAYDSESARKIYNGGPYLSILDMNGPSTGCYASAHFQGSAYCVPMEATHTSMLMDIAVMLRNLNITPSDLNAPISVRVAD
ncbi:MAG: hypothetical protein ABSE69_09660 [Roseiarcus sp.]|jgi:hypothetical protein